MHGMLGKCVGKRNTEGVGNCQDKEVKKKKGEAAGDKVGMGMVDAWQGVGRHTCTHMRSRKCRTYSQLCKG